MIPFKGRIGFEKYTKDKPTKWGIKVWKLVYSAMAHPIRFGIYMGKEEKQD